MAKDAYWFKHDSNSCRDLKMLRIKHIYDFWGIGLYWSVIELLREQNNYNFPSDESSLNLASHLVNCQDKTRFNSWFKDAIKIGLLKDENGVFFSESLNKRMSEWEKQKINGSKGGRPKETQKKPKHKPNKEPKPNHKSIEEEIRKEKKDIFFDAKLKLYYTISGEERIYGNEHQRGQGGLSEMAIKEHCKNEGISYAEFVL